VDSHHRGEIAGDFKKPVLLLPSDWNVTKEEPKPVGPFGLPFLQGRIPSAHRPPLLRIAGTSAACGGQPGSGGGWLFVYGWLAGTAASREFHASRSNALRIVPAYAPAVEPKQVIEIAARQSKPFDVLLRVHSYTTQASEVRAGLTVPRGWKTGAAVPLKFEGVGDAMRD